MFTIKTGEYEVISSGVFHAIENEDTVLSLGDAKFRLIFEKKENESQKVEFKASNDKMAEIILVNVEGSLGFGTTRPFQIGEKEGKKLYMTFVTRSLNDTYLRAFEYTLYTK